MSIFSQTAKF